MPGDRGKPLGGPYRSVRPHQAVLRERVKELAAVRVRSGYRQIQVFLRREGWPVNHKRVYRLYTEEGLTLKRRRPKRHRSAAARQQPAAPTTPNEAWAMDSIHDTLTDGRTIRVLTAIDVFTRECVALEASPTFRGSDVARILGSAGAARGLPGRIRVDHGTEFTSKALGHWAYWNRVDLDQIHRIVIASVQDGLARHMANMCPGFMQFHDPSSLTFKWFIHWLP